MNDFKITNPNRVVYKLDNITKIDVIKYYNSIAKFMFPYLEKRPLSVIRCHNSTSEKCFMKKHPSINSTLIQKFLIDGEEYFTVKSEIGILEQAQFGTLEFHTWGSQFGKINKPNLMIFDLDPDEKLSHNTLCEGVLNLKSVLDELNLKSFLKTSGGKGYHILIPFSSSKNWKNFYAFSQQIAVILEQKWPKLFTTNIRKAERNGKIFVDYLRNSKGATCIAPFSLRAREKPTVSVPISYKDLTKFPPAYFNINTTFDYISKKNPWKDFFDVTQTLT